MMRALRRSSPKRGTRTSLRRKARKATAKACDLLWSKLIRARGRCENCGQQPPSVVLQAAHGFSRRYRGTRWDLVNGFCLCAGCHVRYTYDPLAWDDWLYNRLGEKYQLLRKQALAVCKQDFAAILAELKSRAA